jgi:nitrogen fixation protein NifX
MSKEYTNIKIVSTQENNKGKSMKVAFATSDMEWIDQHFGKTSQFAIYNVRKDGFELDEILKLKAADFGDDEKNDYISDTLRDLGVAIIYVASIGPTAAAKVVKKRIHPLKIQNDTKITEACESLVSMLGTNPPPWIKKIINKENV